MLAASPGQLAQSHRGGRKRNVVVLHRHSAFDDLVVARRARRGATTTSRWNVLNVFLRASAYLGGARLDELGARELISISRWPRWTLPLNYSGKRPMAVSELARDQQNRPRVMARHLPPRHPLTIPQPARQRPGSGRWAKRLPHVEEYVNNTNAVATPARLGVALHMSANLDSHDLRRSRPQCGSSPRSFSRRWFERWGWTGDNVGRKIRIVHEAIQSPPGTEHVSTSRKTKGGDSPRGRREKSRYRKKAREERGNQRYHIVEHNRACGET
jgi:hypothetical protein